MKVCVLASGSSGNSIYIQEGGTRILVDAGLSGAEIQRRLGQIGVLPSSLSALLVTHEHTDHSRGIGVLARRFGLPIWGTGETLCAIESLLRGKERLDPIENDFGFVIEDLAFQAFSLSHDAADPVHFVVEGRDAKLGMATDLGFITHLVRQRLTGTDMVVLEANHDEEMLMTGTYPWDLKQRVRSRIGHLSNTQSAEALVYLARRGLQGAILAHLSQENNTPELALRTVKQALEKAQCERLTLSISSRDKVGEIFVI